MKNHRRDDLVTRKIEHETSKHEGFKKPKNIEDKEEKKTDE